MSIDGQKPTAIVQVRPTPTEFFFDVPLYKVFEPPDVQPHYQDYINSIRFIDGMIDAFCIYCGNSSIFYRQPGAADDVLKHSGYKDFEVRIHCARNNSHEYQFRFKVIDTGIMKIGQYPSVADISLPQLVKYKRILGSELYREFTKAVGLVSHGVGIGSFVYLRRIIEALIGFAHKSAKESAGWNEEDYQRGRVVEKIKMLKGYLPDLMVKHSGVYSILSKGIHELSEDECLRYFKPLQAAIELILNEHLQRIEHENNVKAAEQAIAGILTELAEPTNDEGKVKG